MLTGLIARASHQPARGIHLRARLKLTLLAVVIDKRTARIEHIAIRSLTAKNEWPAFSRQPHTWPDARRIHLNSRVNPFDRPTEGIEFVKATQWLRAG